VAPLLRSREVNEIHILHRQGVSVRTISRLTGFDRKTIRKYLRDGSIPRYGPREPRPSKLDPFVDFLESRLQAGVWNGVVLLRELRERGYRGGYTRLKDYLHPRRRAATEVAVRRFETPPGLQAQADWGHVGYLEEGSQRRAVWAFALTLGYSRALVAELALDQRLETLLKVHEEAFQQLGGVPQEILYDRMKTVLLDVDARGEIRWHPVFLDFARWWGFTPRVCAAYRPQTKGKVESSVKYVKGNFVCGWEGHEFVAARLGLRRWCWEVANRRVHGTTGRRIEEAFAEERPHLQPLTGRRSFPFLIGPLRKVARDAYVQYETNRYSVPWERAGETLQVHAQEGRVELYAGQTPVAVHEESPGRHQVVTDPAHHAGMPYAATPRRGGRKLELRPGPPEVEVRSLASYETLDAGGEP
jgi:transposase